MVPGGPCLSQQHVGGPPAACERKELSGETLNRLQQQLLEDEDFAADMRALLLARLRSKHRSKVCGGDYGGKGTNHMSEEGSSSEASSEEEADGQRTFFAPSSREALRVERLGYKLQKHERLLSKRGTHRKGTTSELLPSCDEEGILRKLEELRYTPHPGMRHVPFIETLAIAAADAKNNLSEQAEAEADLKREARFFAQVKETVPTALSRLLSLGLQFTRPADFMAEMLKSDFQMNRVRSRLLAEQQRQRLFVEKRSKLFNKKFNRLAGHRVIKEQEEARRRNIYLKEFSKWKREREKEVNEGTARKEAEEEFDSWLQKNEDTNNNKNRSNKNCQVAFKQNDANLRQIKHRPHRKRGAGKNLKRKKGRGAGAGQRRDKTNKRNRA